MLAMKDVTFPAASELNIPNQVSGGIGGGGWLNVILKSPAIGKARAGPANERASINNAMGNPSVLNFFTRSLPEDSGLLA